MGHDRARVGVEAGPRPAVSSGAAVTQGRHGSAAAGASDSELRMGVRGAGMGARCPAPALHTSTCNFLAFSFHQAERFL